MPLIEAERDDAALLAAEDAAIMAAAHPVEAPTEDIAALIERLSNGREEAVHVGEVPEG